MPNLISKILSKTHTHTQNASPGPSLSSPGPGSSSLVRTDRSSSTASASSPSGGAAAAVNAIYYPNWAVYRPLPPSSLDLSCVTHILYAFVWPTETGSLESSDRYADDEIGVDGASGCLAAFKKLKRSRPHVKLLLSVGGGGRGSQHFASLSRNGKLREALCQALKAAVVAHGFDGVDLDWEHPSAADEKAGYQALVRDLRRTLPRDAGYVLTAAVPAAAAMLAHYPLSKMADELDYVLVMAYDFSGPWTEVSGHHAALFDADPSAISGADAVAHLRSKGVPLRKCVLGVPAYGRFFPGAGSVGRPYTKPRSDDHATLEYRLLPAPNAMEWVDDARVAAYCVGTDGFTSYDNPKTVALKARWAKDRGLAGLFYWTVLGDRPGEMSLVKAGWEGLQ